MRETAIHGHLRSSIDAALYDFLLALNTNRNFIFNRSWDITPSLHIHTSPLFQVELENDG